MPPPTGFPARHSGTCPICGHPIAPGQPIQATSRVNWESEVEQSMRYEAAVGSQGDQIPAGGWRHLSCPRPYMPVAPGSSRASPIVGWTLTPPPPKVGRPRWSFWWRWVVLTFGANLLVAVAFLLIYPSGGRAGNPLPLLGAIAYGASAGILVGACQSFLLGRYVRAAWRWLAIAVVEMAAYAVYFGSQVELGAEVSRMASFDHTAVEYVRPIMVNTVVAGAEWWFVLRADVPRSVVWVPIAVLGVVASAAVPDLLVATGLPGVAGIALWLIVPVVGATGMVYVLRDKLVPAGAHSVGLASIP